MKTRTKYIIWILGIIILLIIQGTSLTNSKLKVIIKKDIEIERLKKIINTLSPIEELSIKIFKAKKDSELKLLNIQNLKETIKNVESKYETDILRQACYTDQMTRLSQNLESEKGFCEIDDNLEQYRTVKKK